MNQINLKILLITIIGIGLISCNRVVIIVESIPGNSPEGSNIYIAGNFNNWNPSDADYILKFENDSSYYIKLPVGLGLLKYKFTRGEWASEETDLCGHSLSERVVNYNESDTIINRIASWKDKEPLDCPTLTIVLTGIPENTPKDETISVAGNFNNWNPKGDAYKLNKNSAGKYSVTIERDTGLEKIEYKFTRGNLVSIESDEFGNELFARIAEFGKKDTIYAKIDNWEDLADSKKRFIEIIIDKVPENTPRNEKLYLVGNFNGWFPRDKDYIFERLNNGAFFINLPKKRGLLEFKVTRGNWDKQEMDKFGFIIDNRSYRYNETNEIHITIENWLDIIQKKEIVFIINKLSGNTPEDDNIYLAANLNGWNPGDFMYRFNRNKNGKYYYKLKISERYFEYKITRGSWETEQSDKFGNPFSNQIFRYKGEDTVWINIVEWKDKPIRKKNITFIVRYVPKKTPDDEDIYISGNFNGWILNSNKYKLNKSGDEYSISVAVNTKHIAYKFNRGNWKKVEGDNYGREIENRVSDIQNIDTIYIKIKSWRDLYGKIKLW